MNVGDLRVVKTRASIKKAFMTLLLKKILILFRLKKLLNLRKLAEKHFICIILINMIY